MFFAQRTFRTFNSSEINQMTQFIKSSNLSGSGLLTCKALALAIALAGCGGGIDNNAPPIVATDKGHVKGINDSDMFKFLGIPYAAPPVGQSRWKEPAPAASWNGVRDANAYGNVCPQAAGAFGSASTNEDCLYLNVYMPKDTGPFPVMLWIHGGAFVSGDGGAGYDPSKLVAQGVGVVTINYRLGYFGFFAHPELSAEQGGGSGNYGLMDQQAAIQWVKTNIANFRGDPSNITIFGESAGGLSVNAQIASPRAAGLFSKAIVQSGAYNLSQPTLDQAHAGGSAVANAAGCTDQSLTCLRALTAEQILARQVGASIVPTIDNKVLTRTVLSAYQTGNFNKVPTIEGSNADEYSLLSAARMDLVPAVGPITADNYQARVTALTAATGKTFAQVEAQYPLASFATPAEAYDAIATDFVFACTGRLAEQLRSANGAAVYAYEFNDSNAPMLYLPPATRPRWGAYHAAEIQYLFPTTRAGVTYTADQEALKTQMVSYWTQFAKNGNPNGTGPTWTQYSVANDTHMSLEPGTSRSITDFAARHHCAFWLGA
jgi:para-nitrobenzyl esterase